MKKRINKLTNRQKIEVLFNVLRYMRKVEMKTVGMKGEVVVSNDIPKPYLYIVGICGLIRTKCKALLLDKGVSNNKVIDKICDEFLKDFRKVYSTYYPNEIINTSLPILYKFGNSDRNGTSISTWFLDSEEITTKEWYRPRINFIHNWIKDLAMIFEEDKEIESDVECTTVKAIHEECIDEEDTDSEECTALEKLCILDRIIVEILYNMELYSDKYGSEAILYISGLCIHLDREGSTVLINQGEKPNVELCKIKILNLISEFKSVYKSWYNDKSDTDLHYYTFNVGTSHSRVRGWFNSKGEEAILLNTWYEPRLSFVYKWIDFIIEGGKVEYEKFLK
jgi:hypothetical protein